MDKEYATIVLILQNCGRLWIERHLPERDLLGGIVLHEQFVNFWTSLACHLDEELCSVGREGPGTQRTVMERIFEGGTRSPEGSSISPVILPVARSTSCVGFSSWWCLTGLF